METTIAANIAMAKDISLAEGQKKYRTYFISLKLLYGRYKAKTDAILILDGNEDCIVTE